MHSENESNVYEIGFNELWDNFIYICTQNK